mmetsp:Transcript_12344/g.26986  ORF Transcript_12344/g.26986 Transcript_12344/m.26986 type:complete len:162 (+) Transcript_12344:1-486(+)
MAVAAARVSVMEIGGLLGTFASGAVSDLLNGRRILVTLAYFFGLAATLLTVLLTSSVGSGWIDSGLMFLLGFFINGPQCLIGLVAAEVSDRRAVATTTGFLGLVSYAGAVAAGWPISKLIRVLGWPAYVVAMILACTVATACLLPLRNYGANHLAAARGDS